MGAHTADFLGVVISQPHASQLSSLIRLQPLGYWVLDWNNKSGPYNTPALRNRTSVKIKINNTHYVWRCSFLRVIGRCNRFFIKSSCEFIQRCGFWNVWQKFNCITMYQAAIQTNGHHMTYPIETTQYLHSSFVSREKWWTKCSLVHLLVNPGRMGV